MLNASEPAWIAQSVSGAKCTHCTAIIAAKNEGQTIGAVIAATQLYVGEVLVVDGHSTDQTVLEAEKYGARVIPDGGLGKGEALRVGAAAACNDVIIFLDADMSHNPHDIPRIIAPLLAGDADMVIGSRITGGSDELSGSGNAFLRLAGGQLITLFINLRWGTHLTDSQNGFRAIRTPAFLQLGLKENRHTIEQEMLMKALKRRLRVTEVPAHEYKRMVGDSHIRLLKMWYIYILSMVNGIISL